MTKVTINCLYCGDEVVISQAEAKKRKYCSGSCAANHRHKDRKAEQVCPCGRKFRTTKGEIARGGKYCTNRCKYRFRKRPSGLTYSIKVNNRGCFPKGHKPWNAGKSCSDKELQHLIEIGAKPREHRSQKTEFKSEEVARERNAQWMGERVGYRALHTWVRRTFGEPVVCEECGSRKNVEWANMNHFYRRNREDWKALCKKCHVRYDRRTRWGVVSSIFGYNQERSL